MSQTDPTPSPARRRGAPFRAALAVGCLFLVLSGLMVLLMAWQARRSVSQDPGRVLAAAEEILPGARPMEGQVGLFAVEFWGTRMAVLGDPRQASGTPAPPEAGPPAVPTTILMVREGTELDPQEELGRLREEMQDRGYLPAGAKVVRREDLPFRAAGREVRGTRSHLETARHEGFQQFSLVVPGPRGPVLALLVGTGLTPERVQRFLDGLAPGLPAPSASPSGA